MSAWWDDLPRHSIMRHKSGFPVVKDRGVWWFGPVVIAPRELADCQVIYVPVTDQEPPVGSVVEADGQLFQSDGALWECLTLGEGFWSETWSLLRHRVTRILRWGES